MLTIYRRHLASCPNVSKSNPRSRWNCSCPIHAEGRLADEYVRKSLGVTNREAALQMIREWELDGKADVRLTVTEAGTKYLADLEARNIGYSTRNKYSRLFERLEQFASGRNLTYISDLTLDQLTAFRASWTTLSPLTKSKEQERLRTFFRFCSKRGWIEQNPATDLDRVSVKPNPTLPFTGDELERVVKAVDKWTDNWGRTGTESAERVLAFLLALRYTGMRISDVATLPKSAVDWKRDCILLPYQQKTGTPVYVPMHPDLRNALKCLPGTNVRYFFWTGEGERKGAASAWDIRLRKLFELADLKDGHAHRFRDTFAVELLQHDVPIEDVSKLLGHASTRVTEKHYAPWVRARQEKLAAHVKRVWDATNEKERKLVRVK